MARYEGADEGLVHRMSQQGMQFALMSRRTEAVKAQVRVCTDRRWERRIWGCRSDVPRMSHGAETATREIGLVVALSVRRRGTRERVLRIRRMAVSLRGPVKLPHMSFSRRVHVSGDYSVNLILDDLLLFGCAFRIGRQKRSGVTVEGQARLHSRRSLFNSLVYFKVRMF